MPVSLSPPVLNTQATGEASRKSACTFRDHSCMSGQLVPQWVVPYGLLSCCNLIDF